MKNLTMTNQESRPKKQKESLIFNIFRKIDLIVFLGGVIITLILLIIGTSGNIWELILKLIPALIGTVLVMPIPNYHNTLCMIQNMLSNNTENDKLLKKGRCSYEKFNDNKSKK